MGLSSTKMVRVNQKFDTLKIQNHHFSKKHLFYGNINFLSCQILRANHFSARKDPYNPTYDNPKIT